MRHLFIVNPVCAKIKGRVDSVTSNIQAFMAKYPQIDYDIHVTRWRRDALGFCRKYTVNAQGETVRIHIFGGTSTVFEIVNAIVDLQNAQIACYPMGKANVFLHYFCLDKAPLFASIEKQMFSEVIGIDAIRCNQNYVINNALIGLEAYLDNKGNTLIQMTNLPNDLCFSLAALPKLWEKDLTQSYKVRLDGKVLDGDYLSIMVANQPWYSQNLCPGIDARPDDGLMDVYLMKDYGRLKRYQLMPIYLSGRYKEKPGFLTHYRGLRLEIESKELTWLSVDGETFFGNNIECELLPGAIRFVCPDTAYGGGKV